MTWEPKRIRPVGRDLAVVETRGRDRGTLERHQRHRPRRLAGPLRGRADRRGGPAPVLRRGPARGPAARARGGAPVLRLRGAAGGQRIPAELLAAAIAGGVDVIQLREKAPRCAEELIAFAEPFARAAREHGALFFLNDEPGPGRGLRRRRRPRRPGRRAGRAPPAPPPAPAALVGPLDPLAGSSSTRRSRPRGASRPDQISAGPVWETPTKEGRPAAGLELIEHAARRRRATSPGSRSAASTPATSARWSRPGRAGSSSCARSATPPIPRPRRASCGRPSRRLRRLASRRDGEPGAKARRAAQAQGARQRATDEQAARREAMAARTEAKNEAAREALEPLAQGERPLVVTIGAVISALVAISSVDRLRGRGRGDQDRQRRDRAGRAPGADALGDRRRRAHGDDGLRALAGALLGGARLPGAARDRARRRLARPGPGDRVDCRRSGPRC